MNLMQKCWSQWVAEAALYNLDETDCFHLKELLQAKCNTSRDNQERIFFEVIRMRGDLTKVYKIDNSDN